MKDLKLLLLGGSPKHVEAVVAQLERGGLTADWEHVDSESSLRAALQHRWDVVISDRALADLEGPKALGIVRQHRPGVPFIFVSDAMGEARAVAAMRAGARDCLRREELDRLADAVRQALGHAERERRDGDLRRHRETAQRMDAVGRLSRRVGHDVNNLLTVIRGYSGLLLHALPEADPARSDLSAIDKAATTAERLTSQLLACSRPHSWQPEPLGVNGQVIRLVDTLRGILGGDVDLVTDLADGVWEVEFDPVQFEEVLVHLTNNAREAMNGGGRMSIVTGNTRLNGADSGGWPAGEYAMLSVSDTGTGMEEEVLRRCFEPFFTTRAPAGHAGLGLSVVYGIVNYASGCIWSYSEPKVGSCFEVLLPRRGGP